MSVHERYIVMPNGCWIWQGNYSKTGVPRYGQRSAARVIWEDQVGVRLHPNTHLRGCTALGMDCVNPSHREPIDIGDRFADVARAWASWRVGHRPTHCINGHEWNEANTYWNPGTGYRQCRRCRNEQLSAYREQRRLEAALDGCNERPAPPIRVEPDLEATLV